MPAPLDTDKTVAPGFSAAADGAVAVDELSRRVTIKDIAQRAGVHWTTVSLALKHSRRISPATRDRIHSLAAEMGYQPDPVLASLATYRRHLGAPKKLQPLAYLTYWDEEYRWKELRPQQRCFEGAARRAVPLGYELRHLWLGASALARRGLGAVLDDLGVNGVIFGAHGPRSDYPLDLEWRRFSAVKIDFLPRQPGLHSVSSNQRAIMQLAMRRALAAGYRRIGLVLSEWSDRFVEGAWSAGFLVEQQAIAPRDRLPILLVPEGPPALAVPRAPFERWFLLHRPEVLIGSGTYLLPRLLEMKVAVPKDVCFVDLFVDPTQNREIAGVHQNCHRVGELAVEILAGQLHRNMFGLPQYPTSTLVEGVWCDGASLPARR